MGRASYVKRGGAGALTWRQRLLLLSTLTKLYNSPNKASLKAAPRRGSIPQHATYSLSRLLDSALTRLRAAQNINIIRRC